MVRLVHPVLPVADRLNGDIDLSVLTQADRLSGKGSGAAAYFRKLAVLLFERKQIAHADRAEAAVQHIQKYILVNLDASNP